MHKSSPEQVRAECIFEQCIYRQCLDLGFLVCGTPLKHEFMRNTPYSSILSLAHRQTVI